jgi:hypothetical protein
MNRSGTSSEENLALKAAYYAYPVVFTTLMAAAALIPELSVPSMFAATFLP